MDQKDILEALRKVKHPETGNDIVSQGMVENLVVNDSKIQFTLSFSRSRDPFATSLKRACETVLAETFPQYAEWAIKWGFSMPIFMVLQCLRCSA